jgi:hypothetical protein
MHRRYTIHRDGDLLVEDLDASGRPIDPEPVPAEDRLPVEVVVLSPDDVDSKAALLDLLELAHEMEASPEEQRAAKAVKGHKLNVIS